MTIPGNSPASSLQDENRTARMLLDLLRKEQSHLIAADIDALTALTDNKLQLVSRLSELAVRRYQALAAAGFEAKEAGMQAWLGKNDAVFVKDSWNELLALARAAKEINRTNGLLIGKHLTRSQNALNAIKGGQQGQTFYGPNGQSTVKSSVRGLAIG